MKKVLVFDDDDEKKASIAASVPGELGLDVEPMSRPDFEAACTALAVRERDWREHGSHGREDKARAFDKADVILLDFNLAGLLLNTTGAEIAARLRCFSGAGVIVNLNRWGEEREFRLELTWVGDTYADIDIAMKEVKDLASWSHRSGRAEFAPVSRRPILPLLEQMARREKEVQESWDVSVREFFGFTVEEWELLPRTVRAQIGRRRDSDAVTLRQYVLDSGFGLRAGDLTPGNRNQLPPFAARLVAARLGAWLELRLALLEECLAGVGAMVRFLPESFRPEDGDWNRLAREDGSGLLKKYKFKSRTWSTRALWWWSRAQRDQRLPENVSPWTTRAAPVVFASDSGSFIERSVARSFRSDLELNSDRWVGNLEGVLYRPEEYMMRA